jgi:hypothetical protein
MEVHSTYINTYINTYIHTSGAASGAWDMEVRQLRDQLALQSARELAADAKRKRPWTGAGGNLSAESLDPSDEASTSTSFDSASALSQPAIYEVCHVCVCVCARARMRSAHVLVCLGCCSRFTSISFDSALALYLSLRCVMLNI